MGETAKLYSRGWRRKVGEGVSRAYAATLEAQGQTLPDKKRCAKCGETKAAKSFGVRRRELQSGLISENLESWCKECKAQATRERLERLTAEGVDVRARKRETDRARKARMTPDQITALREYQREHQAIRRRKNGQGVRGALNGRQSSYAGDRLPPGPIIALLEKELPLDMKGSNQFASKGILPLAERSGLSQRRIYGLLRGEYERVSLSTVDKLLFGLGLPHMLPILYPEA